MTSVPGALGLATLTPADCSGAARHPTGRAPDESANARLLAPRSVSPKEGVGDFILVSMKEYHCAHDVFAGFFA